MPQQVMNPEEKIREYTRLLKQQCMEMALLRQENKRLRQLLADIFSGWLSSQN